MLEERPAFTRAQILLIVAVAAVIAVISFGRHLAAGAVASGIRSRAAGRGMTASWRRIDLGFPLDVRVLDLTLASASGDTAFRAESLRVEVGPWSLVTLRPRPRSIELTHAAAWLGGGSGAEPDTLAPEEPRGREAEQPERAERLRRSVRRVVELLLAPARDLPHLALRDVTLAAPRREDALLAGARFRWLELRPMADGVRLSADGAFQLERPIPFELALAYGNDDRITGGALLMVPPATGTRAEPLRVALDGRLRQERRSGRLSLGDSTRVAIGRIPFLLAGSLERGGPRVRFALAADRITPADVIESLPRALLGPLLDLSVRGEFGYRLSLDLDLARPDDVQFDADVIPHGLALDPARTRLRLFGLERPFVAAIHLPRGVVTRDLSPANPHFRTLEAIDTLLAHAVVTNEDGGFYRHRGFNTEAVKMAIAANLKAGAFRRGAGTITMQLARNLYLGHERTLSRKAQEVVLAWVLEHLTGVSKRRLLEIYLNIIEWGPGVQGADEATHYYFGHDAGRVSVDEALFLSTVVPAPRKWRYRLDSSGELRRFERAQMHFIGRAMIGKGWLAPETLPPADALRVEIRGPARDVLFPRADSLERVPPGVTEPI